MEPVASQTLSGGLKTALDENLQRNEQVRVSLIGLSGQAIVLTDRRVLILKAGFASGAMFGQKGKGFALTDITSVEFSCGLTEGRIQLTVAGTVEAKHGWQQTRSFIDEVTASRQAENVCQFARPDRARFQQMSNLIQSAADDAKATQQSRSKVSAGPGTADQIRELAALVKEGLISKEEYEAKRRELLARL